MSSLSTMSITYYGIQPNITLYTSMKLTLSAIDKSTLYLYHGCFIDHYLKPAQNIALIFYQSKNFNFFFTL